MRFNLIKLRKRCGLSQEELAEELKCSRVYISEIENGKKNPSFGFIEEFEKFCQRRKIIIDDIWNVFKKE